MTQMALPPFHTCVPHSGPMLFVNHFLAFDPTEQSCMAECVLEQDRIYMAADGRFLSYWLIEIMAQVVAGHFHLSNAQSGAVKRGFLISISDYALLKRDELKPGNKLKINSELDTEVYPIGIYKVTTWLGEQQVARASMSFIVEQ